MSENWIYIGADIDRHQWSKVGMTTRGLQSRHTSSQAPGYFIYTAYNIIDGDVKHIEKQLLEHLEFSHGFARIPHFSTGNKSECFTTHPDDVVYAVESFLEREFPSCVPYEVMYDGLSRYQCDQWVFRQFDRSSLTNTILPDGWCDSFDVDNPSTLSMSKPGYFTSNQVEYETSLGNGYFIDHLTGLQKYRDEDGNEYCDDPK